MKRREISLPLPNREWLVILDRDATIISSREIAYGCFEEAFEKVISEIYPLSEKLTMAEYTRSYHPFERTAVYENYYPRLTPEQLVRVGEVSWQFYLDHCREEEFNRIIPGMDAWIRRLKAAGCLIAILTASEGDGHWMRHYDIPVDGYFSVIRLREEGVISGKKPDAIRHILKRYNRSSRDAVTIGDNPKDHIPGILSIGTAFGLGCPAARRMLKESVDLYASSIRALHKIFGLTPPRSGNSSR